MLRTTKPPRCKVCKSRLDQLRPGQVVHESCIEEYVRRLRAEKAERLAKAERQIRRKRKEAIKKIGEIEEECRKIVQKIARLRDRNEGCISCDKPANWDGQWHGSHYRAHGGCSSLQFHLWNINKACWICNKLYSGRVDVQKVGIVQRYGQERLDWLDCQPKSRKYSREYLARFKKVMGKRLRRMEKRLEME